MPRRPRFDEDLPGEAVDPPRCWLCGRQLGARTERHHPRPKSEGGRVTVPMHPICHRTLHASFTNKELAMMERSGERPADQPALRPFLRFLANKAPDFHAPTRRRRSG